MSSVLNNGNDVGPVGCHVDEISSASVAELNRVYDPGWANNVGNMTDRSTTGGPKVQDLASWLHVYGLHSTKYASRKLGSEWIPDSVFRADGWGCISVGISSVDGRLD